MQNIHAVVDRHLVAVLCLGSSDTPTDHDGQELSDLKIGPNILNPVPKLLEA